MEKLRRKANFTMDSFSFVFSPGMDELSFTHQQGADHDEDDKEEFMTVRSCFTCCSSAATASRDEFMTVRTNFSRCSSLNEMMIQEMRRRSIIQEFCHCQVAVRPVPEAPIASASAQVSNRVMVMEERYQAEKDALYLVVL